MDANEEAHEDHVAPALVWRSFSADDINPILNHPSVFPWISIPGIEHIDVTKLVADPRNVLMMAQGGGIMFCHQEPGVYEVHTNFLEPNRGRHALRASLAAYRWMFTHTDCEELLTRVPAFNKAAEKFCQIVGASFEFERDKAWPTKDGPVSMKFYALRYPEWMKRTPELKASGHMFHEHLTGERERLGKTGEREHPDDVFHDAAVGACAEMIYGGQPDKAVILYNRWARFAGYGTIGLIARNPLLIDIGDALIQVTDDTFKIITCR